MGLQSRTWLRIYWTSKYLALPLLFPSFRATQFRGHTDTHPWWVWGGLLLFARAAVFQGCLWLRGRVFVIQGGTISSQNPLSATSFISSKGWRFDLHLLVAYLVFVFVFFPIGSKLKRRRKGVIYLPPPKILARYHGGDKWEGKKEKRSSAKAIA